MAKLLVVLLLCSFLAAVVSKSVVGPKRLRSPPGRKTFETRIVGGEDAEEGELPYQIALLYGDFQFCGASLIQVKGRQVVITAGHCVDDYDYRTDLWGGEHNLNRRSGHEQRRRITNIIIHEEYDGDSLVNDIALLTIDQPYDITEWVKPIDLPPRMQNTTEDVVVSGWGDLWSWGPSPDVLQKVQIPIVDDATCARCYPEEIVLPSALCAGLLEEGGKDSCQGDSGGPLRAANGNYLAGIVSWGYGCAAPGLPGVNTEVSHFIDWIEDKIASLPQH